MRYHVPSRILHAAGIALVFLFVAWAATSSPALAVLCGVTGLGYSASMLVVPDRMPRLIVEAEGASSDRVFRWAQRGMGAAAVPLWVLVLRNRPLAWLPPRHVLLPIAIGLAVAIVFELTGRRAS